MDRLSKKRITRVRRKKRVRKKIVGTVTRPRLSVYKSNKNISVQAIDDINGTTLASISTLGKELAGMKSSVDSGKIVGQKIAKKLENMAVSTIIFDRNGYRYHGIVKAIAEGAREAGLKF